MNVASHSHEFTLGASTSELAAAAVAFAAEATPEQLVLMFLSDAVAAEVAPAVSPTAVIRHLDEHAARPASALRRLTDAVAQHGASFESVRIVDERPPAPVEAWCEWCRYEGAITSGVIDPRLHLLCLYRAEHLDGPMVGALTALHPCLRADGHRTDSPAFSPAEVEPLVRQTWWVANGIGSPVWAGLGAPEIELVDPTPHDARMAVTRAASLGGAAPEVVSDLVLAVSELVTNAHTHGTPPVRMALWTTDDRVLARISDAGHGPPDPFAGLIARPREHGGGLGLWISHQVADMAHQVAPDGYSAWVAVGTDG